MADLLEEAAVTAGLEDLPGWSRDSNAIVLDAALRDFPAAIAVVNQVAEVAEREGHHPDIDIRWRTLTFRCSTHSAGGITALDLRMAGLISEVLGKTAKD